MGLTSIVSTFIVAAHIIFCRFLFTGYLTSQIGVAAAVADAAQVAGQDFVTVAMDRCYGAEHLLVGCQPVVSCSTCLSVGPTVCLSVRSSHLAACLPLLMPDVNKKAALHFDFNYAQSFFKFRTTLLALVIVSCRLLPFLSIPFRSVPFYSVVVGTCWRCRHATKINN